MILNQESLIKVNALWANMMSCIIIMVEKCKKSLFGYSNINISDDVKTSRAVMKSTLISDFGIIVLKNTGQSEARNVRIKLDGILIDSYPGILIKEDYYSIPAHNSLVIQACLKTDQFPSDSIEIVWDDREGDNKYYRIQLYE